MKAKTSIKKALSLIVVLVMLLTMIPAGIISANAAPTIDLGDYDSAEEYVIMNVEDWILIATTAQDKDFSGITVKLGADLDFGSYTEIWDQEHASLEGTWNPRLDGGSPSSGQEIAVGYAATVPTLFREFAGTFDGQGYTIKNARFEEAAIAAKTLDGAEINDVVFENVSATDFYDYIKYGIVVGEATGSLYMDSIVIKDSAVHADSFNTYHFGSAGALIGYACPAEDVEGAAIEITNCVIDADVACGNYQGWGYGLGTGLAVGTIDIGYDFTMTDCTFGGSVDSIDWYIGVIGALYLGEGNIATIENITIDGLSVNSNRKAVTDGVQSMGSLAGLISLYDNASCYIDKVNVVNTALYSNNAHGVGGFLGMIQPIMSPAAKGGISSAGGYGRIYDQTVENASVEISNIYVDASVCCDSTTGGGIGAAGLIAQLGQGNNSSAGAGRVMTGEINIYNIYVGGTIITGKYDPTLETWTLSQGSGGLFYAVSLAETVTNVSNVVINAQFPLEPQFAEAPENLEQLLADFAYTANPEDPDNDAKLLAKEAAKTELTAYSAEVKKCVGLISSGGHVRQQSTAGYEDKLGADSYMEGYINVSDVATTLRGDIQLFSWLNRKGGITYNGTDIGRGDKAVYAPAVLNDSVVQVRPIEALQMVKLDSNGFVEDVAGAIANAPVQVTAVSANTVDIRFIALVYVDEVAAGGVKVDFTDADGNVLKSFVSEEVELLDELTAVADTAIPAYSAKDFAAKKFMAITITNVPVGTEMGIEWQFAYQIGENTTFGDENAAVLKANGTFEQ